VQARIRVPLRNIFFDMDNLESFLSVYEEVSLDRTICF